MHPVDVHSPQHPLPASHQKGIRRCHRNLCISGQHCQLQGHRHSHIPHLQLWAIRCQEGFLRAISRNRDKFLDWFPTRGWNLLAWVSEASVLDHHSQGGRVFIRKGTALLSPRCSLTSRILASQYWIFWCGIIASSQLTYPHLFSLATHLQQLWTDRRHPENIRKEISIQQNAVWSHPIGSKSVQAGTTWHRALIPELINHQVPRAHPGIIETEWPRTECNQIASEQEQKLTAACRWRAGRED